MLLGGIGCALPSGKQSVMVLDTGDRITRAFRGFHQDSFPTDFWTCEDGDLRSIPGKRVDLITREKFEDFEFECDWKLPPGGNSGIFIGVTEATSETYWSAPEMQINEDVLNPDGKVPNTSAGALYGLIAPNDRKRLKPAGEYNHAGIVSRNGHVEYWLNHERIVEYEWDGAAVRELIQHSKFKDQPYFMKDRNGYIGLQSEGYEVWFRNIRIRRLPKVD